ncbi:hypothetical protein SLEP1_g8596 [Rubroshorea leprosula]|uniref:1-aminocyclopropane-1-carboxylate synthase n=1 Tax=Rubroshorea leprosula TaxID=152421 RepID=A0AAV5IA50_9ROSI|nr:hypothetical protein SLEP1_g8596 [Rubroshorea leprosula]
MGLPGFRVGIVYSYNDAVVNCARRMSSFGLVSSQTQHLIAAMLSDDEFVDRFIAKSKERLDKRRKVFTEGLEQVKIDCLNGNAGLFMWMDLRRLLKDQSSKAEMELWKVIINEIKLNVSPGSSFHCTEPGWFRVCIANMDDSTMEVALSRITDFMHQNRDQNKEVKVPARKQRQQSSLKLSLSRGKVEDFMSQINVFPHTPIPQSSLVPART